MIRQDFNVLKEWFDDFSEDKLRCFTGENMAGYLAHYLKRFMDSGVNMDGAKALEIGCGDGKATQHLANIFPNTHFLAIDFSENNIRIAEKDYVAENIQYEVANVATDKWSPLSQYDLIFSFSVVQYFDPFSYRKLQEKLFRNLAVGGAIVHMSIPDKAFFWKSLIGEGLWAPFKLVLLWPFKVKDYANNCYANGFWWDKKEIQLFSPTANIEILPSDSFYRFDIIERRYE